MYIVYETFCCVTAVKKLGSHDKNWGQGRPPSLDVVTIHLAAIVTTPENYRKHYRHWDIGIGQHLRPSILGVGLSKNGGNLSPPHNPNVTVKTSLFLVYRYGQAKYLTATMTPTPDVTDEHRPAADPAAVNEMMIRTSAARCWTSLARD